MITKLEYITVYSWQFNMARETLIFNRKFIFYGHGVVTSQMWLLQLILWIANRLVISHMAEPGLLVLWLSSVNPAPPRYTHAKISHNTTCILALCRSNPCPSNHSFHYITFITQFCSVPEFHHRFRECTRQWPHHRNLIQRTTSLTDHLLTMTMCSRLLPMQAAWCWPTIHMMGTIVQTFQTRVKTS